MNLSKILIKEMNTKIIFNSVAYVLGGAAALVTLWALDKMGLELWCIAYGLIY